MYLHRCCALASFPAVVDVVSLAYRSFRLIWLAVDSIPVAVSIDTVTNVNAETVVADANAIVKRATIVDLYDTYARARCLLAVAVDCNDIQSGYLDLSY